MALMIDKREGVTVVDHGGAMDGFHSNRVGLGPPLLPTASPAPTPLREAGLSPLYVLQGTLVAGTRVIRVETPGPSMHEVDIFRLRRNSTVADVDRWRKPEDAGQSSETERTADAESGLLESHELHRLSWLCRNFRRGRYVFHCEMPMDPAATVGNVGVTHADVGMVSEIFGWAVKALGGAHAAQEMYSGPRCARGSPDDRQQGARSHLQRKIAAASHDVDKITDMRGKVTSVFVALIAQSIRRLTSGGGGGQV